MPPTAEMTVANDNVLMGKGHMPTGPCHVTRKTAAKLQFVQNPAATQQLNACLS